MNTPNPLVPQGSLLERQKSRGKSNLFIAFFTILTIHVVLFGGLLMQGCKREKPQTTAQETSAVAPFETNFFAPTNLPALPTQTNFETEVPPPLPTPSGVAPAVSEVAPPSEMKEYTVVQGDSYYKIAKEHGITVSAMKEANPNVNPRKLKVGQVLHLPPPEPAAAASATSGGAGAGQGVYTVKPGDTLTTIAKSHSTTIKAIRALNNLRTTRLMVGQKLKLPPPKAPATSGEPGTSQPSNPAAAGGASASESHRANEWV
ncbi:MAG: LysM peptidoglycan-binding domain-containing protein [Candidatus Omnitrophica bacterium]|nr:LysM peptidoglycan-binding domain-containing protein [Candidatus Omnitrophota bacterium]